MNQFSVKNVFEDISTLVCIVITTYTSSLCMFFVWTYASVAART